MRNVLGTLFLGAFLLGAGPAVPLAAQASSLQEEPLNCQKCTETNYPDEGWFHNMTGTSCIIPETNCFDCTKDDGCHSIEYAGRCDINVDANKGHHWCGTEQALIEFKTLRDGGKITEEAALLRVANRYPGSVKLSAAGYYVVTNCTGAVVAAFKQQGAPITKPNPVRRT